MTSDVLKLLTCADVARRLNVSLSFFRKLVQSERAPKPLKLGRARRWPAETIDAWLAAGCPAMSAWTPPKP